MAKILPFYGGYLSQWYPCAFSAKPPILGLAENHTSFEVQGGSFNCAEQWMMMGKAAVFNDEEIAEQIFESTDPKVMKQLGRQVKNFDEDVWVKSRLGIVYLGNYMKFSQNPELKKKLLATKGKILVEASPYDKIWGVGLSKDDKRIRWPSEWLGLNLLGFTLMKVRAALFYTEQFDIACKEINNWQSLHLK